MSEPQANLDYLYDPLSYEQGAPIEQLADFFLLSGGALARPIVLKTLEALVGHEAQLIEEILTRVMPEHAGVRRVVQLERFARVCFRRSRMGTGGDGCGRGAPLEEVSSLHDAMTVRRATNSVQVTEGAQLLFDCT